MALKIIPQNTFLKLQDGNSGDHPDGGQIQRFFFLPRNIISNSLCCKRQCIIALNVINVIMVHYLRGEEIKSLPPQPGICNRIFGVLKFVV